MPSLPPRGRPGRGNVFRLLARPQVALGMTAILLLFMGQFALFTYLRPFLETVTGLSVPAALAGVPGDRPRRSRREPGASAGCWAGASMLVLIGIPAVMAAIAVLLIVFGQSQPAVVGLLVLWGFFGTAAPVGLGHVAGPRHARRRRSRRRTAGRRHPVRHHDRRRRRRPDVRRRRLVERLRRRPRLLLLGSSLAAFAAWQELGESEMTHMIRSTLTRRTVLAGAAASLALPRFGRAQQTGAAMRLRCRFADQDFTYRLLDNADRRGTWSSLLPLDLTIERFLDQREDRPPAAPAGRRRPRPLRRRGAGRPLLLPRLGQSRLLPRQLHLSWRPDPARPHRGRGGAAAGARRVPAAARAAFLKETHHGDLPRRPDPVPRGPGRLVHRPRPHRRAVQPGGPDRVQGAQVTFEPGARTAWHTHPLGQTLIVTSGLGRAQREGGPVEEIRPGDVVWFAPGEKHWHGASPATAHDPYRHPGSRATARSSTGWNTSPTPTTAPEPDRKEPNMLATVLHGTRRRPLRGCRRAEDPEADRRDHQAVGHLRLRLRPLALPRAAAGRRPDAHGPRILRRGGRGRQRREDGQARPVRRRLVLPLRQHLPALPARLPVLLRAARVHVRRAGALRPRAAGRRHAGRRRRACRTRI